MKGITMQDTAFQTKIKNKLISLGISIDEKRSFEGESKRLKFYRLDNMQQWEGKDPKEQLGKIPETLYTLFMIDWRGDTIALRNNEDGEQDEIEFSGTTENFDTTYNDERVLLYQFAWNMNTQILYCVNLLENSEDLNVYSIDHDGTSLLLESYSILEFLNSLEKL